jgi:hypothetical protein
MCNALTPEGSTKTSREGGPTVTLKKFCCTQPWTPGNENPRYNCMACVMTMSDRRISCADLRRFIIPKCVVKWAKRRQQLGNAPPRSVADAPSKLASWHCKKIKSSCTHGHLQRNGPVLCSSKKAHLKHKQKTALPACTDLRKKSGLGGRKEGRKRQQEP